MKKLLMAFMVSVFFFAGFAAAENTIDKVCDGIVDHLQDLCEKAVNAENSTEKWLSDKTGNEKIFTGLKKENIKKEETTIDNSRDYDRSKKEFLKGKLRIEFIKSDKEAKYSDFQKEKMFIEAIDLFSLSEKISRKPVILSGGILPGPSDTEDGTEYMVNKFITKFINGSLIFLFSLGTLMLIIGGIMFLVSSGDSEILTKAKDTIFWGIVGIGLAVMSYAIVKFAVGLDFGL